MSSSTIPSNVLHSQVEPSIGGSMLGMILSIMFYGVTLLQTYIYYDSYWGDPSLMRIYVAVLFVLDTAQVVAVIDAVWFYVVPNFGNVDALSGVHPSLAVEIGITVRYCSCEMLSTGSEMLRQQISIGLLVQSFFAMRVRFSEYALQNQLLDSFCAVSGRNRIIPALIFALTLAQFALGIYYATISDRIDQPIAIQHRVIKILLASLACGMAADFLITTSLVYYLHRGRSGLRTTDRLINILITYTINTGSLTLLAAMCTIILNQLKPTLFWDVVPYFLLSKCYVNSTLATLNARTRLRNMTSGVTTDTAQLELGVLQEGSTPKGLHNNVASGIQFAVSTEITDTTAIESILVPEFA